jgi:hypothetical protein
MHATIARQTLKSSPAPFRGSRFDASLLSRSPLGCLTVCLCLFCGGCWASDTPLADITFEFNTGLAADSHPTEMPLFRALTVSGPPTGRIGVHAPALAAFEDGELLAAWFAYSGPHELTGSAIYTARWSVEEEGWSQANLHVDRPQGDGNPVLYAEGDRVWLFQAVVLGGWSTSRIEFQASTDRGHQWSTPRSLSGPIGTNDRFAPIRTASGNLLFPAYDDLLHRALFFSSSGEDNWGLTSVIDCPEGHECIQPSVAKLPGGRLLAVLRNVGQEWAVGYCLRRRRPALGQTS